MVTIDRQTAQLPDGIAALVDRLSHDHGRALVLEAVVASLVAAIDEWAPAPTKRTDADRRLLSSLPLRHARRLLEEPNG